MPLIGVREFEDALKRVAAEADAAAKANVTKAASIVEARAKANFEGAHKKGMPHTGGDKPNVVSGTLRRSIRHEPVERTGLGTYSTRVGPATVYARSVELGHTEGARKYPYFVPAVHDSQDDIQSAAGEQWRRFMHL